MTSNSIKSESTILGYTLKDRIGSGGYGEVWSALAPGGIEKAVKFVYGFHDEKRAQTEIKALDRVKQLRHPFLLSLERIDIVDGQLVIISELAECCLAEVFNRYIAQGEPGIPREELLVYMRDTADALDYLSKTHSLQHLDVKPENLLIVSGHVKVADFGLVKELDVTAQSLMTGMTPAYAAPELFDGQPGEKSDQYSLAIVYQEMLTSVRPFPGTTPAQLAAQHMHGRPNLRPLPKGDQSVIAKALSKDPNVRFPSCREMVDELFNKKLHKKTIRRIEVPRQMADTDSNTMAVNESGGRDMTAIVSSANLPFQSVEIDKLEPPEIGDRKAELQPVIVVSIGNMANQAASKLKQRLVARHGSVNELPSVRMICIDTNRQDLSALSMMGGAASLSDKELVATPLRKAEIYRDRAKSHLKWLSRRWIYNIPRSLQTEGLRPLGRLAFADHFEDICRVVQNAIEEVCLEENIAATSETLGIPPGTKLQPRVYVVSSISGGSSGMTLDLAYTIKTLMIERGLEPSSVTGVLMHSTNRRAREPGLSAANSFALLTELRHYNDLGYPGDETLGLPEFQDEPPFSQVYYLDLGVDLKQTGLDEKLNSIAEWIYLNSLSNCSVFFDACREITKDSEHFDLRTFGLSINGPGKQVSGISQADALVVDLIKKWTGGGRDSTFEAKQKAVQFFNEFDLHSDGITNIIDELLQNELSDEQFAELLANSKDIVREATQDHGQKLEDFFDSVFGVPSLRQEVGYVEPELCPKFEQIVGNEAYPMGDQIAALAIESLQMEKLDLANPHEFVKECYERLEQTKTRLDVAARGCESQLNDLRSVINELSAPKRQSKSDSVELYDQCLQSYRQFRWQEFVLRNAKHFCQVVRKNLVAVDGMVEKYRTQLDQVSRRFESEDVADPFNAPLKSAFDLERLMMETVFQTQDKLIERMEIQLYEELVRGKGGFLELLNESFSLQTELPETMREIAIQVLTDAYKKVSIDRIIADNKIAPDKIKGWLNEQMNMALPDVRQCGGGARLMAGFPQHADQSQLPSLIEQQFNVRSAGVNGTSGDFVLCFEGEEVALAGVAFKLLETRPDAAELSKRIHCRKDIEWTTLNDLL